MELLFGLLCLILYLRNFLTVIFSLNKPADGLFVLRCVGTIYAPLGCFLGLF